MSGAAILTAEEMRAAEQAIFDSGVAPYALMETAGAAAADVIWRAGGVRDTLVLCGPGNNGGDGFVIARLLKARGVPVRVAATGESKTDSSQKARRAWAGPVENIADAAPATQIVDALFGIGLARGLDGALAQRLGELVDAAERSYAIDVPSGVDTDGGVLLSPVPRFDLCIALGALKPAHVLQPAAGTFARLICADIGIGANDAKAFLLTPPDLAEPAPDAHKYTRGLVDIVAGTMAGAGILAATAAAHAGAGCVRHLAPEPTSRLPNAVIMVTAPDAGAVTKALQDERIASVLVGPGLGRSDEARKRLSAAVTAGHPLVVDADGITLLEAAPDMLPVGTIITPHEGEFSRLFGEITGNKIDRAREAARRMGGVVVYKGPDTAIASADGRIAVWHGGSPWLSTAGTGDVLAGICAARLAVTGDPFLAACEAVWLHGEAARRAGAAFIADDLIAHIPAAVAARTQ
ncbi:NAD(P)H-hydrate dehydratase [Sphingobium phenoxybenzoativorans]|uniref:NAD(P)H-hydrate dehydratase n=1 Tax=Sphingobium phenoxybenzoativorans TaxID=1592790 RepID=UPI001FEAF783|nr:NAD(P)H-hydrate dehydratase [Sphingobium phenoxybenzoativorans]